MSDPWPRFKSFVFCTMIFVIFGTLLNWGELMSGNIKGLDEPIGKVVFILAAIAIALILLVQKLDFKWIAKISTLISACLVYYLLTFQFRHSITAVSFRDSMGLIGEGLYFTIAASVLTTFFSLVASRKTIE